MAHRDEDITPAILLQHMQGMEKRLDAKIDAVRVDLQKDINRVETSLGKRIDRVDRKVELLSVQINNIDERLDDVEVMQVPAIKRKIGLEAA